MHSVQLPSESATEPEHPLIGTTLRGTYRIHRVLDQGGMGTVFEAEHARLHRRVAVKVLASHLVSDVQALARFRREAEIVSQLQHPHIVQIMDFDTTEHGEPYIVMEFLQGESLAARLERDGCLPMFEALRIVYQTGLALAAAHRASIVHRDLKPANIFLVPMPGQGHSVKLLDFGISKRPSVGRGLTGEHDVLGTPDYMAPEQARGLTAQVDHRGDQYALAVIAFEMLSGQMPFTGTSVMEVLTKVVSEYPPAIDVIAPHVPVAVSPVLQQALSKDPNERYPGILEFAAALSGAAGCSVPPPIELFTVAATLPARAAFSDDDVERLPERFQTGPRRRSRAQDWQAELSVAPTLFGIAAEENVSHAAAQARQALGLGDLDLAVTYAESALRLADRLNTEAAKAELDQAATLIEQILESRIGSLQGRLVVKSVPSNLSRVSPEQAFILSRVDDGISVEEALDLSPLSRRETMRALVSMIRCGFVAVE